MKSKFIFAILVVFALATTVGWGHAAQCMLANPSFEHPGTGGAIFAGWNQFGIVGSSATATHGKVSAKVSGPNSGVWDVSGYWQAQDCVPGERWKATVKGWHTAVRPLTGGCTALLNIEWRNSGGGLISYESHTVVSASTPTGQIVSYSVVSGAAPAGTVSARLLLGALQSPTDPVPDVYFDQATFESQGPPTLASLQWSDFPGGRTLAFGGYTWRVKGPGYFGPGPNLFKDASTSAWVDTSSRLHLTIQKIAGSWYSTEVVLADPLGYGDYQFTTRGRLDTLDPNAVLGIFLWEYGPCYDPANGWWDPYNEIDVEFSRWGAPANANAQFVCQPYDTPGNIHRFNATFSDGEVTTHAFRWLFDRVEYRSWRGGPLDELPANLIHSWTYSGADLPRPDQPRVHLNLWQFNAPPAANQEAVFDRFTFVPAGSIVGVPGGPRAGIADGQLGAASPSPFRGNTSIRFALAQEGAAQIAIFDLSGRRVRTLVDGVLGAGEHRATWDGRSDSGARVASAVYFYQLRTGNSVETRRVILLK